MKDFIDKLIQENKLILLKDDEAEDARRYLKEAYICAKENSDDKSTWTGAVAVMKGEVISVRANKFSQGVKNTPKRNERPLKYEVLDHAERQCVYFAAKNGSKLDGAVMYTPLVPCCSCANAVISSGFSEIVLHYEETVKIPDDWWVNVSEAVSMLIEGGVKVSIFKGEVGGVENLLRGEIWKP